MGKPPKRQKGKPLNIPNKYKKPNKGKKPSSKNRGKHVGQLYDYPQQFRRQGDNEDFNNGVIRLQGEADKVKLAKRWSNQRSKRTFNWITGEWMNTEETYRR